MIQPLYEVDRFLLERLTEEKRLTLQIAADQAAVGPDAARKIARRIEDQHGFWDYNERKAAA